MSVIFDLAKWEEFVKVWQTSRTADEAAKRLGLDKKLLAAKAGALRKLGVELRRFAARGPKLTSSDVLRLKALARQSVLAGTLVPATKRSSRDDD